MNVDLRSRTLPLSDVLRTYCHRRLTSALNPYAIHVERAVATDMPTMLGTTASMQLGGEGSVPPTGTPLITPPRTANAESALNVKGLPRIPPTTGVTNLKRHVSWTVTRSPSSYGFAVPLTFVNVGSGISVRRHFPSAP